MNQQSRENRTFVIFNADDFGLSKEINQGIISAYQQGILNSASILVNGEELDQAVEFTRNNPDFGAGVHLNILEGKTKRKTGKNELLCDMAGNYQYNFPLLLFNLVSQKVLLLKEIEVEFRHQIETALNCGINIDHLNSHIHAHQIPSVFQIVCKLAREYQIPFVRQVNERLIFHHYLDYFMTGFSWIGINLVKHFLLNSFSRRNFRIIQANNILINNFFIGVLFTGHMCAKAVITGLDDIMRYNTDKDNIIEVLFHPALKLGDNFSGIPQNYKINYRRRINDYNNLIKNELKDYCQQQAVHCVNYKMLNLMLNNEQS